jgi:hypothetical protein
VLAARKRRLLERLRASLPSFLDPGERPELALQAVVDLNVTLAAAGIAAGAFVVIVAIQGVFGGSLGGLWQAMLVGGLVGGGVGTLMTVAARWVVVTDRRVLFLRVGFFDQRPTRLDTVDPRTAVAAVPRNLTTWGWRSATYRRPNGTTSTLRVNRMWHEELPALIALVGVPPAPGTIPQA